MKNIQAFILALAMIGTHTFVKAQNSDTYYSPQNMASTGDSMQGRMGYLAINIGLAQPVGMFASAKNTSYGGYAMPGSVINLSLGLTPEHSKLGVALMCGNYYNSFNAGRYIANVGQGDAAHIYYPTTQDGYTSSVILAGLLYTIPVRKISFDLRLLGGMAKYSFPEIAYAAYQYNGITGNTDYYNWYIAPSTSAALAADFGAGIRYNFGSSMAVMFNVDYLYSNPPYNTTEAVTSPNGNTSYMNIYGNTKVTPFSYTLGFGYQIGR